MAKSALNIQLSEVIKSNATLSDKEFINQINQIILQVEKDPSYTSNDRLKIFDKLSFLTNCDPKERKKYGKKAARLL